MRDQNENSSAQASQVCHALNMVAELPLYSDDARLPAVVQIACLESFYINLRLLIEFLVVKPSKKMIHRHDFLPGWEPAESRGIQRLREELGFASEQVAHLAKSRIPEAGDIISNVSPETLAAMASLVFDEMEQFCSALAAAEATQARYFASCLATARERTRLRARP